MSIEEEIQAKGLTAPRVTPADIEAEIASEHYFTAADGFFGALGHDADSVNAPPALHLLTFCVLVLRNGFTVTGESACASPENFDAAIGRKIARQKAIEKVWPLLGFRLRDSIAATTTKPMSRIDMLGELVKRLRREQGVDATSILLCGEDYHGILYEGGMSIVADPRGGYVVNGINVQRHDRDGIRLHDALKDETGTYLQVKTHYSGEVSGFLDFRGPRANNPAGR